MSSQRKNEHIALVHKHYQEKQMSDFQNIKFVHHAFPPINAQEVQLNSQIGPLKLDFPFFINAMTGGSDETKRINEDLAIVARETGLVMATGSMSILFKHPELSDSFQIVRKQNPNGLIFANLGAGHSIENAKRAVAVLEADALQIHVNATQELIMPEGDRDFKLWLSNIETIVCQLEVPVIVKEVGFGMSRETIQQLIDCGVQIIDVSGRGGTNFAQIENSRRKDVSYDFLEDWGQSTVVSLIEAQSNPHIDYIASGGIKNPLDVVKSLALGAKAVGVSGEFLHVLQEQGIEATIRFVNEWKTQVQTIMALLGKVKVEDLVKTDLILTGDAQDYCETRNLDWKSLANRTSKGH
jgi:isopentenyl-diphosphate Delta-isomerase